MLVSLIQSGRILCLSHQRLTGSNGRLSLLNLERTKNFIATMGLLAQSGKLWYLDMGLRHIWISRYASAAVNSAWRLMLFFQITQSPYCFSPIVVYIDLL